MIAFCVFSSIKNIMKNSVYSWNLIFAKGLSKYHILICSSRNLVMVFEGCGGQGERKEGGFGL